LFERFEDFVQTFTIRRGKNRTRDEIEDQTVGEFKVFDYYEEKKISPQNRIRARFIYALAAKLTHFDYNLISLGNIQSVSFTQQSQRSITT
jgi:hypothetical protein